MSVNSLNTFLNIRDAHLRVVSGNVHATAMNIGGINVDVAHGLQSVTDQGNVTSNTLQFSNATTAFVTTANVTVGRDLTVTGNALVSSNLTVTGNVTVSDDLTVTENLFVSNNLTVTKDVTVTGNTFYTNPMSISVDSNVVAEYTGPHDRPLRKYPEVAMTSASQGGYVASASSYPGNYEPYEAFDNILGTTPVGSTSNYWSTDTGTTGTYGGFTTHPGPLTFNGGTGATVTTNVGGVPKYGEWLQIEFPHKVKYSYSVIRAPPDYAVRQPRDGYIVGSNDLTGQWTTLHRFEDVTRSGVDDDVTYTPPSAPIQSFKYFRIVIEAITTGGQSYAGINKWELYGHEEGDSSLDTTLKSVYNVPGTQQLEVYYDAKDLTAMPTTVTDLAGGDQNGAVTGATLDETGGIESFNFDGSNDIIQGTFSGHTVSSGYTMATWIKPGTIGDDDYIATFGVGNTGTSIGINFETIGGAFRAFVWGSSSAVAKTSDNVVHKDQWVHVAATFISSGGIINLYINNKLAATGSGTTLSSISASAPLVLGARNSNGTIERHANFKMANFRLFSKALNAGQVQELYDYQKDYFLGSRSSVTLYKGHLGIGVAEPSGQLELAGDERIQEYPPRDLGGFETLVEGQGTYKVSSSSDVTNPDLGDGTTSGTTTDHPAIAFTANNTFFRGVNGTYNTTSVPAPYTGTHFTNGVGGDFLQIELPHKINLKSINITSRTNGSVFYDRGPHTGSIFGSNDGGTTWSRVASWTGLNWTLGEAKPIQINSNTLYSTYRLVASELQNTVGAGATRFNIDRWQLFGTPGPTTLDKGSLTLGRSLDVPRISRYDVDTETPRPEKLVVDFDTTVNSSPTDISGQGNHGVFVNGASYSAADKAFTFDGTNDYIQTAPLGFSGDRVHSVSLWFWSDVAQSTFNTDEHALYGTGGVSNSTESGISLYNTYALVWRAAGGTAYPLTFNANQWNHMCMTYSSGGSVNSRLWLNGNELAQTTTSSSTYSFQASDYLIIGTWINNATVDTSHTWDGNISNFKIYNVALEPSEVRKLYNLGRTGRSMVISDTAVGIGKVPDAQLSVRGSISATGTIRSRRPMWSVGFKPGSSYTLPQTEAAMLWTPVNYDYTGNYDSSTGYYTIPITGYYAIGVRALVNVPTGQVRVDAWVRKISGGTTTRVIMGERVAGSEGGRATGSNMTCQVHGTVYLQSGDQVYAGYTATTASVGYVVSIDTDFNEFHGRLIEEVIS